MRALQRAPIPGAPAESFHTPYRRMLQDRRVAFCVSHLLAIGCYLVCTGQSRTLAWLWLYGLGIPGVAIWTVLVERRLSRMSPKAEPDGTVLIRTSWGDTLQVPAGEQGLAGVNLSGRWLREAVLAGTDFRGVNLARANLRSAYLRGCRLDRADLRQADLASADLQAAALCGADLRGTRFEVDGRLPATFTGPVGEAVLSGAVYDGTTVWPRQFRPEEWGCVRVPDDWNQLSTAGDTSLRCQQVRRNGTGP